MVSDTDVIAAKTFTFQHLKLIAEPGGAMALAAVLSGQFAIKIQAVGVAISGGNVDPVVFARAVGL